MSKHGPGHTLRRIARRLDAIARGVELGRQRRMPSAEESAAHRALGLESLLWEGYDRGRKLAARLEQMRLEI
jgi:hypothetical protein